MQDERIPALPLVPATLTTDREDDARIASPTQAGITIFLVPRKVLDDLPSDMTHYGGGDGSGNTVRVARQLVRPAMDGVRDHAAPDRRIANSMTIR